MKISSCASCLYLLGSLSLASAYTEGWKPGQPVTKYLTSSTTAAGSAPTGSIPNNAKPFSLKDIKLPTLEGILTSRSVGGLLNKVGFNVSAQLEMAREGIPPRFTTMIPLIKDDNYKDLIYNEQFASEKEAEERVWAILISIGSQDPVSTFFDRTFDGAHNLTLKADDMKNVKWGRVDYLEVTEVTTRWVVWKAPVLVIVKDNGQELRFFKVNDLKKMREPEQMRHFLLNEEWRASPPWGGPWSPSGNRAPFLEKYAEYSAFFYFYINMMPRWLLLLITGTIASTAINFFHSEPEAPAGAKKDEDEEPEWVKKDREEEEAKKKKSKPATAAASTSASPSKSNGAKKRKSKK